MFPIMTWKISIIEKFTLCMIIWLWTLSFSGNPHYTVAILVSWATIIYSLNECGNTKLNKQCVSDIVINCFRWFIRKHDIMRNGSICTCALTYLHGNSHLRTAMSTTKCGHFYFEIKLSGLKVHIFRWLHLSSK